MVVQQLVPVIRRLMCKVIPQELTQFPVVSDILIVITYPLAQSLRSPVLELEGHSVISSVPPGDSLGVLKGRAAFNLRIRETGLHQLLTQRPSLHALDKSSCIRVGQEAFFTLFLPFQVTVDLSGIPYPYIGFHQVAEGIALAVVST